MRVAASFDPSLLATRSLRACTSASMSGSSSATVPVGSVVVVATTVSSVVASEASYVLAAAGEDEAADEGDQRRCDAFMRVPGCGRWRTSRPPRDALRSRWSPCRRARPR